MKSLTSSRISNCGYKLYIRVGLLNSEASKKHSLTQWLSAPFGKEDSLHLCTSFKDSSAILVIILTTELKTARQAARSFNSSSCLLSSWNIHPTRVTSRKWMRFRNSTKTLKSPAYSLYFWRINISSVFGFEIECHRLSPTSCNFFRWRNHFFCCDFILRLENPL